MMRSYYQRKIESLHSDIARLQGDKATQASKIADLTRSINRASEAATRTRSASTAQSRLREVERLQRSLTDARRRSADIDGKIAKKQGELGDAQKNLAREEDRERQRSLREGKRQSEELRRMSGTVSTHSRLHEATRQELRDLRKLPEKIVVLFLASNPLDQEQLRLDEEVRAIQEMVRKADYRDSVKLESRWAVRSGDVLQSINELNPQIVHFSGHGSDQDEIVLQNDRGETRLVSKEAIVQVMMADAGNIRLVFFNTCFSAGQAEAVVDHVEAAIGMGASIGDEAARVFAAQFYSAISFGHSVRTAFEQAKAGLMLEGIPEHDVPQLFVAENLNPAELIIVRPEAVGTG